MIPLEVVFGMPKRLVTTFVTFSYLMYTFGHIFYLKKKVSMKELVKDFFLERCTCIKTIRPGNSTGGHFFNNS